MEDFVSDDPRHSSADALLDELLPESLDWDRLVRTYPLPAMLLAAVGGFLIGRRHGKVLLSAVTGFATARIAQTVTSVMGREIG